MRSARADTPLANGLPIDMHRIADVGCHARHSNLDPLRAHRTNCMNSCAYGPVDMSLHRLVYQPSIGSSSPGARRNPNLGDACARF